MKFSLRYPEEGPPTLDSKRFRNRLAACISDMLSNNVGNAMELVVYLERETGTILDGANSLRQVENLFQKGELRDVRDAITHIYDYLLNEQLDPEAWRIFVVRVLKEENIGYIMDDDGGVQYLVDEAFQTNRAIAVRALQKPVYKGVLAAFEDAHRHFNTDDTKAAVRSMYEALEILAKQLKAVPRLSEQLVNDLRKQYGNRYDDQAARTTYNALFDAMVKWVVGLQVYRHGQGVDKIIAPDEITCVHILSAGTSYIRWLIDLENKPSLPTTASRTDK